MDFDIDFDIDIFVSTQFQEMRDTSDSCYVALFFTATEMLLWTRQFVGIRVFETNVNILDLFLARRQDTCIVNSRYGTARRRQD